MEPRGVRLACPECTWDCVMKSEQDVPDGVRKVVEGVPWCPNCNLPMKPIASVDTTERPKTGLSAAMTLEQIAAKVVEINHEAIELGKELKDAAEVHKDAKKAYDAKLVTLSLAVERLGRVMGGEQIQADRPLLDLAEDEPADESVMGAAVRLEAEEIRQQLAQSLIVVGVDEITGWTLEQYDAVVKFLSEVADSPETFTPLFLSTDVPDHVQALHLALGEAGVEITLADVCAWSQEQRNTARVWVDDPERSERPAFIPGEEPEPARAVPRRRARKQGPVVTV